MELDIAITKTTFSARLHTIKSIVKKYMKNLPFYLYSKSHISTKLIPLSLKIYYFMIKYVKLWPFMRFFGLKSNFDHISKNGFFIRRSIKPIEFSKNQHIFHCWFYDKITKSNEKKNLFEFGRFDVDLEKNITKACSRHLEKRQDIKVLI